MNNNHVQIVKDFFAAMGRGDKQALLALSAEDIEWIIPGEGWPLAGTHRGHAGLADLLQKASETVETSFPKPFEFVSQGDRVLVIGFATGRINATNKTFEDDWVFAITVQNGKLKSIREYIDTQALAEASQMAADSTGNEEIIKKTLCCWRAARIGPREVCLLFLGGRLHVGYGFRHEVSRKGHWRLYRRPRKCLSRCPP